MITRRNLVHCRAHVCRIYRQSQRVIFPEGTFCAGLFTPPAAGGDEKENRNIEKEKAALMTETDPR